MTAVSARLVSVEIIDVWMQHPTARFIGHEMFELEMLRSIFAEGAPVERWEAETSPNNPGNFHWQAWDHADELVARMREEDG